MILLTGRNECIEKYFETIRDLGARGFDGATMDWRGQGGSDRLLATAMRGYVRQLRRLCRATSTCSSSEVVLPDCRGPYYVLAHSTGALIALLADAVAGQPRAAHGADRAVPRRCIGLPLVACRRSRRLADMLYWLGLRPHLCLWRQRRPSRRPSRPTS